MIDHSTLKALTLTPEYEVTEQGDGEIVLGPVAVTATCPVCHWGLVVTVTPAEVVG